MVYQGFRPTVSIMAFDSLSGFCAEGHVEIRSKAAAGESQLASHHLLKRLFGFVLFQCVIEALGFDRFSGCGSGVLSGCSELCSQSLCRTR